jgi:hypothetical protein
MRRLLGVLVGVLLLGGGTAQASTGGRMDFPHKRAQQTRLALPPLSPAPSNTVWFHLVLNDGMRDVMRVERAIVDEQAQVASVWDVPVIRFGRSGIPVYIAPYATVEEVCGELEAGCHLLVPNQAIYVENFAENGTLGDVNQDAMTSVLSHEIFEATVDPDGTRPEICDPVAWQGAWQEHRADGVVVSAWTLPSFFS